MNEARKITALLGQFLEKKLNTIAQYEAICRNLRGLRCDELREILVNQVAEEMLHAERLIDRIIMEGATPNIESLGKNPVNVQIADSFKREIRDRKEAIVLYEDCIRLADTVSDLGTTNLVRFILIDEKMHLEWLRTQVAQIDKIGWAAYFAGLSQTPVRYSLSL